MIKAGLHHIIQKGEGIQTEFKKATFELPKNVLESVCAMLNRQGGHLFLGVRDDGTIEGVSEACVADIKAAFVTSVNNAAQLNPTYYLSVNDVVIDGKTVLHTFIPESSQVHSFLGRIYDRNEDGDFDITGNPDLVRQLHLRKQGSFSENIIYPAISFTDLRADLIKRCRVLADNHRPGHPWMEMSDEEMLRSANLWKRDWHTGKEGYTLAGALLLGNDYVIQQILPFYKTDALLRRDDVDRYDDREIVRTNLIESYDKLMAFIAKHLPDRFHLEGDHRVSLRDKLFREVVANTLIHREYLNEYPARMIITREDVRIDNWNRPHGSGRLHLESFSPVPKNPVLAAFFREIGRADELGSGYRNSERFTRLYTKGGAPVFEEGDVFRTVIPLTYGVERPADRVSEPVDGWLAGGVAGGLSGGVAGGLSGGLSGGVNRTVGGVNGGVFADVLKAVDAAPIDVSKATLSKIGALLLAIVNEEGERVPFYQKAANLGSIRTAERYVGYLRAAGLVEFKGPAPKTGGYYITGKLKERIGKGPAS